MHTTIYCLPFCLSNISSIIFYVNTILFCFINYI
uniref:Uncharacterized protein n=1 Tax=Siphoviridae sp. ctiOl67 TaxID=2825622 RepID=A0A8S5QI49_9CAUD|nr:MAG TPA: hypothetical protein [Siphoviridae sp. ctiOl67]